MDPATASLLSKFAEHGVLGLVAAVMGYVIWRLDIRISGMIAERQAREVEYQTRLSALNTEHQTRVAQLINERQAREIEYQTKLSMQTAQHQEMLAELSDGRLNDAKAFGERAIDLSDRIHDSVDKVAALVDRIVPAPKGKPHG
jgi:cobyrinic acid a,c-diamide synthase